MIYSSVFFYPLTEIHQLLKSQTEFCYCSKHFENATHIYSFDSTSKPANVSKNKVDKSNREANKLLGFKIHSCTFLGHFPEVLFSSLFHIILDIRFSSHKIFTLTKPLCTESSLLIKKIGAQLQPHSFKHFLVEKSCF